MNANKYFAAQSAVENYNEWERKYLYLMDRVQGRVLVSETMIEKMGTMGADEIREMLQKLPRCGEQPLPL